MRETRVWRCPGRRPALPWLKRAGGPAVDRYQGAPRLIVSPSASLKPLLPIEAADATRPVLPFPSLARPCLPAQSQQAFSADLRPGSKAGRLLQKETIILLTPQLLSSLLLRLSPRFRRKGRCGPRESSTGPADKEAFLDGVVCILGR